MAISVVEILGGHLFCEVQQKFGNWIEPCVVEWLVGVWLLLVFGGCFAFWSWDEGWALKGVLEGGKVGAVLEGGMG